MVGGPGRALSGALAMVEVNLVHWWRAIMEVERVKAEGEKQEVEQANNLGSTFCESFLTLQPDKYLYSIKMEK